MKRSVAGALLLGMGAVVLWTAVSMRSREPRYANHDLSEWLCAYDTNWRFPDQRPLLTDEQTDEALDAIGEKAIPHLLRWLQGEDSSPKVKLNSLLQRQPWIRFRFRGGKDKQSLAVAGFMYLGASAKAAQPVLLQMTLSPDPHLRLLGYEALFFTRPEKNIFLPVAYRALKESDPGIQEMSAQWLVERFPEEAERAGMRARFPIFYSSQTNITSSSSLERMERCKTPLW